MSIEKIITKSKNTDFYNPNDVDDLEIELWNNINEDTTLGFLWIIGLFTLLCIGIGFYITILT